MIQLVIKYDDDDDESLYVISLALASLHYKNGCIFIFDCFVRKFT